MVWKTQNQTFVREGITGSNTLLNYQLPYRMYIFAMVTFLKGTIQPWGRLESTGSVKHTPACRVLNEHA